MANSYFQFKQFIIHQDQCVLKVGTDACLLGAFAANYLSKTPNNVNSILDIGSGSGLLMLMLAQKFNAQIDGIEIDKSSYEQAEQNIKNSPWKERLNLFNADANAFSFPHKYDFIITNPPFFEGDLKSFSSKKNIAKHDAGLTLYQLLTIVEASLLPEGNLAILLPTHRANNFLYHAGEKKLYPSYRLEIKQTPRHKAFRSIIVLSRIQTVAVQEELVIKETEMAYSPGFVSLLKDYYLYL
ncbi:MAG TPA: methyltransferase [Chitinophagaceae bacterium]|nr:methyltransferase [Chitinophagaceae bacterium]